MRHCRLPAARCVRRRDVLAKLMLVQSSKPLSFPRGSRTVGVRVLPREIRSAWRPRFVDLGTVENSDAVEALGCLAGGAASRGGEDRDFFFIAGRFANRAPSELPEVSLARWVQPASGGGYPTVVRRLKQRRYRSASFLKVEQVVTAALRRRSRNCCICKLLAKHDRKCDKSCLGCSGPF